MFYLHVPNHEQLLTLNPCVDFHVESPTFIPAVMEKAVCCICNVIPREHPIYLGAW